MIKKAFGTYEIAKICDVTPSTVGNWIEKKLIPTFTTGGGHRRVWAEDLYRFLTDHNIPIPSRLKELISFSVLIVDDEEQIRKLVQRAIKRLSPDIDVHEAADGFEAGKKTAQLIPALVVLDLKLPGMDGFKVCENIRADSRLKNTKIIAISGHNLDEYKKKALSAGADVFLPKPFTINQILEEIENLSGIKFNQDKNNF